METSKSTEEVNQEENTVESSNNGNVDSAAIDSEDKPSTSSVFNAARTAAAGSSSNSQRSEKKAQVDVNSNTFKNSAQGKVKKRRYRLRSCKDDPEDDDDGSIQVEGKTRQETDNKHAAVESGRPKRLKNRKKRKTAEKHSPTAYEPTTSTPLHDNGTVGDTGMDMDEEDSSDTSTPSSSTSTSSSMSSSKYEREEDEELTDDEEWLAKHTQPLGMPAWSAVKELCKRQYGCRSHYWQSKVQASLGFVQRLERQHTLDGHQGCVNSLHFNQTGTLLASGSDDLLLNVWDFQSGDREPFISYSSGHRSNIFQSKFVPNSSDLTLVSCGRDGQVRVGYLSSTGVCRDTKKLAQHRGSAHKLALDRAGRNSCFLSCGEDGVVKEIDLRDDACSRNLVTVREGDTKIALYSIDSSPRQPFEFAVSGREEWARIYDRRMLPRDNPQHTARYSPHHLQYSRTKSTNITCLVYNHDGTELLCSYNDDDIYLFDLTHSSEDDFVKRFKGHRNNATVKGVNFYGPNSEFIVSGSDCGNIYLWEKESSQVVRFMHGDEGGVVNVLEPHPNLPMLATSGLDSDIKIWAPSGDGVLDHEQLKKLMLENRKERHDDMNNQSMDSQLLWFLMRSLRSRHQRETAHSPDDTSSESSDSDPDRPRSRVDCLPS